MDMSMRIRVIIAQRRKQKLFLIRRRRELRDCSDPFSIPDARFKELFRFPKHLAKCFIDELSIFMEHRQKIHGLPSFLRILIAIRFYATGSYQRIVGDGFMLTMSQSSMSRCIKEVSHIINDHLLGKYIVFPQTPTQLNEHKTKFYQQHNFPGVIGCIDGTHVTIKKPNKDIEHVYECRKGGYSKNIQIICDADLLILSVNPKFGGTAHDAFVWKSSLLQQHLYNLYQTGERNFWLLGDSGYPQQPWLMTPILNTSNEKEDSYNVAHKSTRNCVERCIGVLKGRFRCLSRERLLCYSASECGFIINACSVLHNIFVRNRIDLDELDVVADDLEYEVLDDPEYSIERSSHLSEGRQARCELVAEYF